MGDLPEWAPRSSSNDADIKTCRSRLGTAFSPPCYSLLREIILTYVVVSCPAIPDYTNTYSQQIAGSGSVVEALCQ